MIPFFGRVIMVKNDLEPETMFTFCANNAFLFLQNVFCR